ncbi:EamA family transporter [Lentibacillus saliphilus]|uniref:EamA family transporter n=1 Tax=Lentibacillus saliphilus TaxID=2737028 RepID=UPI001C2F2160|nr:EamA family transporter [Lentibacillus saliphilus]
MWFLFSILTALAWGGANLFYKKGTDPDDKLSHLKIVVMVGLVMGIHAVLYMIVKDVAFDPFDMVRYFPVSALYILSMTIGYIGLRYIELSIAAPVQNSSGAVSAVLLFIFFPRELSMLDIMGVIIVTVGVIGLAVLEKQDEVQAIQKQSGQIDKKYQIGVLAITFPILYSLIDGLGTFADGIYLDELELISESSALIAYELTFFICAVLAFVYIRVIKKQRFNLFVERDKGYAAILETVGQFFYVFAMAGNAIIAAPLIAAHGIFSVILSRIFLKEVLSTKHYIMIGVVMAGIIILGVTDAL